jgi:hypothetical protein
MHPKLNTIKLIDGKVGIPLLLTFKSFKINWKIQLSNYQYCLVLFLN